MVINTKLSTRQDEYEVGINRMINPPIQILQLAEAASLDRKHTEQICRILLFIIKGDKKYKLHKSGWDSIAQRTLTQKSL